MKKNLKTFVCGLALICMTTGFYTLKSRTIGSDVSQSETKSITAGDCYVDAIPKRTVCLASCGGTTDVQKRTTSPSGGSSATETCVTGGTCKYQSRNELTCGSP
jgi:hypothetical protein